MVTSHRWLVTTTLNSTLVAEAELQDSSIVTVSSAGQGWPRNHIILTFFGTKTELYSEQENTFWQ